MDTHFRRIPVVAVGKKVGRGETRAGELPGLAPKSQEGRVETLMRAEAAGLWGCGRTGKVSRRKLNQTWR